VAKTSLGAEDSVPWSYHKDAVRLARGLKKEGFTIHALEEHEQAVDLRTAAREYSGSLLILGNEISGVDPELLELSDRIFHIPMRGEKRSFNVAIAFSIAAYALSIK
jgi:tRNA G18 (ribose-2'-O)-methylase SpoU